MISQKPYRIAILASGSGSNAEVLIRHFENHPRIGINLVLCNKPGAYVLERAERLGVPAFVFGRDDFSPEGMAGVLFEEYSITHLVLAGFLWLVPESFIHRFPGRIYNLHPALLPAYGGKGMYGHHVHKAVIKAGETQTGITIHLVDELYDHGTILYQASCPVLPGDTPDTLATRIHRLEHLHYPRVIEEDLLKIHGPATR